jgi:ComF family protein
MGFSNMEHRVTRARDAWVVRALRAAFRSPCLVCGATSSERFLCPQCRADSAIDASLHEYRVPLQRGTLSVQALGRYWARSGTAPSPAARLLHRFKYTHERRAGRALVHVLAAQGMPALDGSHVVLVPIPLHRHRLRARGFNQAAWLARGLARSGCGVIAADTLTRRSDDAPRPGRTARERRAGAAPLFVARKRPPPDRTLILVDDVCTTGATLAAAANALAAEGVVAARAIVLLLADRSRRDDTVSPSEKS